MKNNLARNILIVKQLEEFLSVIKDVKVILLKGIGLIYLSEEYFSVRELEDIDLLVRPQDFQKVENALIGIGYRKAKLDPSAFFKEGQPAYIDVSTSIWYLDELQNQEIWDNAIRIPDFKNVYHLAPEDFYVHILAHASLHHGLRDKKWLNDLLTLKKIFPLTDLQKKLDSLGFGNIEKIYAGVDSVPQNACKSYQFLLNSSIAGKGHILRFLFLPNKKKIRYLLRTLFPGKDFIRRRYDLKNNFEVFIWVLLRPFHLCFTLANTFLKTYLRI